jgi:hypothetical protein
MKCCLWGRQRLDFLRRFLPYERGNGASHRTRRRGHDRLSKLSRERADGRAWAFVRGRPASVRKFDEGPPAHSDAGCHLVRLLQGQTMLSVGLLPHAVVREGAAPSRPCGAARGSRESRSPCVAWKCAAPPYPSVSPNRDLGSRCAGPAARRSSRHGLHPLTLHLQLHQPLGRKANRLPQNIRVGVLLYKRAKLHHLVGHWGVLGQVCVSKPTLTGKSPMTARKPVRSLRRYGWARERTARLRRATPSPGTHSTIWLDPGMQWEATPSGRRGRRQVFSDAAIQTCLTMEVLFGM